MNYPGVSRHGDKWQARIWIEKKRIHLGSFHDWFDALCARIAAENKYSYVKRQKKIDSRTYPLRSCPYCDKDIPNISNRGKILQRGHYAQRATCGDHECFKAALKCKIRPPVRVSAMDRFIYSCRL